MRPVRRLVGAWLVVLAGCSSTVDGTMTDAGDAAADVRTDAGAEAAVDTGPALVCDCPSGRCAVGQSWRAPDGCNTCVCMAGGQVGCTLIGCVVPDAGPVERQCGSNADCSADEVCEYAMGCATTRGRCVSNGCQSLPVAPQYCGCNGATIQRGSACLPDQPWRAMGACPDAG